MLLFIYFFSIYIILFYFKIKLTKTFSLEIVPRVIDVGIDEFHIFFNKYKDVSQAYKTKHFEDRGFFEHYTATMVNFFFYLLSINFY